MLNYIITLWLYSKCKIYNFNSLKLFFLRLFQGFFQFWIYQQSVLKVVIFSTDPWLDRTKSMRNALRDVQLGGFLHWEKSTQTKYCILPWVRNDYLFSQKCIILFCNVHIRQCYRLWYIPKKQKLKNQNMLK